jgi:hypothetical protein
MRAPRLTPIAAGDHDTLAVQILVHIVPTACHLREYLDQHAHDNERDYKVPNHYKAL